MAHNFRSRTLTRKRAVATALMATLSVIWMIGSIVSFCVLFASAMIHGRPGGQYYELLTHQVPTVSSAFSVGALIAFPVATLIGFLLGWPNLHDDDYRRAFAYNLLPCINLLVLWLDSMF